MNKIIYHFCYHNHRNHFEMLDRIVNTLDYYKEMNDIKRFSLNLKLFKDKTEILFVDIIPHFMIPEIYTFNFEESMKETEIFEKIIKQCSILLSQTINNNPQPTSVAQYSDTLEYDLNKFTSEYAVEISTWSQERKDWFNTFAYTRGNIRIPKEPIVPPKWKD